MLNAAHLWGIFMSVSMVTRIERVDVESLFRESGSSSPVSMHGDHFDAVFERRMSRASESFPVAAREDVSWKEDQGYLAKMARILVTVKESSRKNKVADGQAVAIDRNALLPALRGVRAACQAVDDILSGGVRQVICATRVDALHRDGLSDVAGYNMFGNAVIAAFYALSKPNVARVAIIDFDMERDPAMIDFVSKVPDFLFISVSAGRPSVGGAGKEAGASNIHQVVLPRFCHSDDAGQIFDGQVGRLIREFAPDFVFLSLRPDRYRGGADGVSGEFVHEKVFTMVQGGGESRYICILEAVEDDSVVENYSKGHIRFSGE